MEIPKLLQVSAETHINPANIAVFKDYGKRLEIFTTGGTRVEVKGEWVTPLRNAILAQIPNDDTICMIHSTCSGADEDCWGRDGKKCYTTVAPEETTSLIREMCANWKTCAEKPRHDEKCTIKNFFKCYVSNSEVIEEPEAINKIDPTIDPSIDTEEIDFEMSFSKSKHTIGRALEGRECEFTDNCLDVDVGCSKLKDNILTLSNIPVCFKFLIEPEVCDACDIKEKCNAFDTGSCPVDEITEAKNKS